MAAPKPDFGASLGYGASPTAVGKLLTCTVNKGNVPKARSDSQGDTSKSYISGKPDCGSLSFTAQVDKSNIDTMETQYNVVQQWVYTDPDGGKLTCASGCLCDLEFQTNNDDNTATYTGKVEFYAAATYSTS